MTRPDAGPAADRPGWITFLSDFGFEDPFLGVCKGVIARIAPQVRVLDLLHLVRPQDTDHAASVLASSLPYLPSPAVHLVVVDPFRPAPARGVAVRTADGSVFVSPDNGVTSQAWPQAGGAVEARLLDNSALWSPHPARTFRARDVFAPVAAHLAAGTPLAEVGPPLPVEELELLPEREPFVHDDHVHGEVVTVDHFGNLTLNLHRSHLERAGISLDDTVELRCNGKAREVPFLLTYGQAERHGLVACEDSFGTVTLAVNGGSAATALRVSRGDPIVLSRSPRASAPRRAASSPRTL